MNFKVRVDDHFYDVHVGNITDKPILVTIDDIVFEVWPGQETTLPAAKNISVRSAPAQTEPEQLTSSPAQSGMSIATGTSTGDPARFRLVRAPIPGVITSISVQPGSEVSVGQELCKLEAMKMNNSIRSNHAGIISSVNISIGQHVKHNDTLMEFAE